MKVELVSYDYVGGTRDGEWGVNLIIDGKEEPISFMDEAEALEYLITWYLETPFAVNITRSHSG